MQAALAMDATHSTDPTVYNAKIKDIGNGVSGAVVVNTYKDGVAALASGKSVHWVGAGGITQYNQYNNSQQGYILVKYDASGNEGHDRHADVGADGRSHRRRRWVIGSADRRISR